MELTDDAFLGGQLKILQPAQAYRAGLDAVLLAAAIPLTAGAGAHFLDAGAGVGVVGLAVARRVGDARVSLVEIEPELLKLAAENIARNGLGGRVEVIAADVLAGGAALVPSPDGAGLKAGQFHHVAANPPYLRDGHGSASPDRLKSRAHGMLEAGLEAWVRFLAAAAANGGTATMIHRADALAAVLAAMTPRFGAVKVLPVHPRAGAPASRIIVQGIKGSRAPLEIRPALVLHGEGSGFLPSIEAILRGGERLVL